MQFLPTLFSRYNSVLHLHPYKTQIATGGVLWLCGDLISQKFENQGGKIDWVRAAKMASYGFCVAGPLYAWWYKILDLKTIHILDSGKKFARGRYIFAKLALDQVVFEVPYLLVFFSISTLLMNDGTKELSLFQQIKEKVKNEYIYTYVTDWKVWPPLQFLNFAFVPVRYHSMVVNSVCVGWNGFLSYVTNREPPAPPIAAPPSSSSTNTSNSEITPTNSPLKSILAANVPGVGSFDFKFFSQRSYHPMRNFFNFSVERNSLPSSISMIDPSLFFTSNHFCYPNIFKF